MQGHHNVQNLHPGSLFNMRIKELELLAWNQEKDFEKPKPILFARMISDVDAIVSTPDQYFKLDVSKTPPKEKYGSESLGGENSEGSLVFHQTYKDADVLFRECGQLTVLKKKGEETKAGRQPRKGYVMGDRIWWIEKEGSLHTAPLSKLDSVDELQQGVIDFTVDIGFTVLSLTEGGIVTDLAKKTNVKLQQPGTYHMISKKANWIVVARSNKGKEDLLLLGLDLVPRDELDVSHLGKISCLQAINIEGNEYVLCCAGGRLLLCIVSGYVLRDIHTIGDKSTDFIGFSLSNEFEGIVWSGSGSIWRFKLNSSH